MSRSARTPAFTITELMVTTAIIALLIGLTLPALSNAKIRSSEIAALNDLRQIGLSIQMYTQDAAGAYPFHTPGAMYLVGPPDDPIGFLSSSHNPWDMAYCWPTLMHHVAPWRDHYQSWIGQGRATGPLPWLDESGDTWLPPGYRMSNTLIASPATWGAPGTPTIRAIKNSQVRFPSAKATFYDRSRPYLPPRRAAGSKRPVLLADASAKIADDADASPPAQNQLREQPPTIYNDTKAGVEGRDF